MAKKKKKGLVAKPGLAGWVCVEMFLRRYPDGVAIIGQYDDKEPGVLASLQECEEVIFAEFDWNDRSRFKTVDNVVSTTFISKFAKHMNVPANTTVIDLDKTLPEMLWDYLAFETECPSVAKWIGDYDKWTFKYDESLPFYYGTGTMNLCPAKETKALWGRLLDGEEALLKDILTRGEKILSTLQLTNQIACNELTFETTLVNPKDSSKTIRALCANARGSNSKFFGDMAKEGGYDITILFGYVARSGRWSYSVYSSNPEVKADEIAGWFGGRGNEGAATFSSKEGPIVPLGTYDGRTEIYQDMFEPIWEKYNKSNYLRQYFGRQERTALFGMAYPTNIEGIPCYTVNTFVTRPELFFQRDVSKWEVGVSYVGTNCGKWKLIFHDLVDKPSNLETLKEKFNGRIVNGAVWAYVDQLPFNPKRVYIEY